VATEALLLALALSCTLSCPKSRQSMVMVADQLRKLGGMLWDIRIPREVLEAVCEMHLEVAETISGHLVMRNGCWMLHDVGCYTTYGSVLQTVYGTCSSMPMCGRRQTQLDDSLPSAENTPTSATHATSTIMLSLSPYIVGMLGLTKRLYRR